MIELAFPYLLQFICEYTSKIDELIKDKLEAQKEVKAKQAKEKDMVAQQESKVSGLHERIGVCDQIMGMSIPLSYTRLTSRFLVMCHLTLPIILWDDCHGVPLPLSVQHRCFGIEEVLIGLSATRLLLTSINYIYDGELVAPLLFDA